MGKISSGVYPVFENEFKIGTLGRTSETTSLKTIADMETFSISMDGNVEEWTPMDTEGWTRRLATGKAFTISLTGKRNIGDAGNDYVAGLAFSNGQDLNSVCEWIMPDGTTIKFNCVINVTNSNGGDSTNVAPLEFDLMSDGKPTVTAGA